MNAISGRVTVYRSHPQPFPLSPAYFATPRERWQALVDGFRQKLLPRKILVAGPYTGEFGHEFAFRALVLPRVRHYREAYVISYAGRDVLYPGCTLIAHDIPLEAAGYGHGRFGPAAHRNMAQRLLPNLPRGSYDLFTTLVANMRLFKRRLFEPRHEPIAHPSTPGDETDILFHFRAIRKQGPDRRPDFNGIHADNLWKACASLGLRCACIGDPAYAYCPAGCLDFRTTNLSQTVGRIGGTRLVVGQQSGPTHLANHCGKPSLVWAEGRLRAGLRMNPLQVPIFTVTDTTWLPNTGEIVEKIRMVWNEVQLGPLPKCQG